MSGKSSRALISSIAPTSTRNSPHAARSSLRSSSSCPANDVTMSATSTSASRSSSLRIKVSSRSKGPSNVSRSRSSTGAVTEGRLTGRADASLGDGHRRATRRSRSRADDARPGAPVLPHELPPDEERHREHEEDGRHPEVQPLAEELVRGVDAQLLLEDAAERVPGDVEGEQARRADADQPLDEQQHPDADEVVDELVQEDRVEVLRAAGCEIEEVDRAVLGVDVEPPRQARRLAEELLVPPVAPPPDALGEQQRRREAVGEQ